MFLGKIDSLSNKVFNKHIELDFELFQKKTISLLAQKVLISLGQLFISLPVFVVLAPLSLFVSQRSLRMTTAILAVHFYNGVLNLKFGIKHSFYPVTEEAYREKSTSDEQCSTMCRAFVSE